MRRVFDLAGLDWQVAGFSPHSWRSPESMELGMPPRAEVPPVAARVPGSVQAALKEAGLLPDWNEGVAAKACEWVENRHWMYQARIPAEWLSEGTGCRLVCKGLDHAGWVHVSGREVGSFEGAFTPHVFDLTPALREEGNLLQIVFDLPPRWLGQCGWTSRMTHWKPRFNYTWDWCPRLVQIGIWDDILLEVTDGIEIAGFRCVAGFDPAAARGALRVWGGVSGGEGCRVRLSLQRDGSILKSEEVTPEKLAEGLEWGGLEVSPWWPSGLGDQPLCTLRCELVGGGGEVVDSRERRVGFKRIDWESCEGAPAEADPWICAVNGERVFLQGVNWTPIRPNFADLTTAQYRRRIETYLDLGCNVLRVWGGAFLEKECFYELCDEHGLLVWQEFPLSSSGVENWPPEDLKSIEELAAVARSYVERRQHHACLLLWCGGNELQGALDGGKVGCGLPVGMDHPLLQRLAEVVAEEDPGRRFLPASSSGPRFTAELESFGQGLHWDVHGPWVLPGGTIETARAYWERDDALFRSELGAPGASSAGVINEFSGGLPAMPANEESPLWRRSDWWIEWPAFIKEMGREPSSLEEYVQWSQQRQADALRMAAWACKARFPGIGGVIIWMGHDCFPCTANTSILDFHGRPKPAALALRKIFRVPPEEL